MNGEKLFDKLRKLLALTTSPVEGEAHAAAHKLQELLTEHNLNVADLESRGQAKPAVREDKHDLGKAAFKWKLDLAEVMADHYYCFPLVDRYTKTVAFVGRPDNIKSLQMLYGWVIDQIKRIGSEEEGPPGFHRRARGPAAVASRIRAGRRRAAGRAADRHPPEGRHQ